MTVVISGLAIWSLFARPTAKVTMLTKVQVVLAVLSLLAGALLYALYGAHIAKNAEAFSYSILAVALFSSLFITMERALRE